MSEFEKRWNVEHSAELNLRRPSHFNLSLISIHSPLHGPCGTEPPPNAIDKEPYASDAQVGDMACSTSSLSFARMDARATKEDHPRRVGEIGAMHAVQEEACRRSVTLLGLVLVAAFALPGASALAQSLPPINLLGGQEKRKLTPEEQARQNQIDADYKAANSKVPTQKAPDPWGDMRQGPAASGPKASASTQNASPQKKKQSAQQPQ
jgi:hypothetical protein